MSMFEGSSNLSLRSNGSFRRKARIPVTGFTERAFLANERKMTNEADIIVKEDLEYLAKIDNHEENGKEFAYTENNDVFKKPQTTVQPVIMENLNTVRAEITENPSCAKSTKSNQRNCENNLIDQLNIINSSKGNMPSKSKSEAITPSKERVSFRVKEANDTEETSNRGRGMSVSSIASRDSLSSISSFSSSFMMDRIFHWKRSSTKSIKSPDMSKSLSISHAERCEADQDQNQQIDLIAADSLASYNSVSDDCNRLSCAIGAPDLRLLGKHPYTQCGKVLA